MSNVTMTYNGSDISPVPIIVNITRNNATTQSGTIIGSSYTITLEGHIISETGIQDLLDQKALLAQIFDCNNEYLEIKCDSNLILRACITAVDISFTGSQDNWVKSIPYTISLTANYVSSMPSCSVDYNLTSLIDEWSFQEDPECYYFNLSGEENLPRTFLANRNIQATASDGCSGEEGWQIAKDYIDSVLELDTGLFGEIAGSCMINYNVYDDVRVFNISKTNGSYGVSQTMRIVEENTGLRTNAASETFTMEVQENDGLSTVSIQGSIQGHESTVYTGACKTVLTGKYDNANTYWDFISPLILQRAEIYSGLTLRPYPVAKSVGRSPKAGIITYAYQYTDLVNCLTAPTGIEIISENIAISYTLPTDVYPEIYILGRLCPLLQNLNIQSKGTKTLSVDISSSPRNYCVIDDEWSNPPIKPTVDTLVDQCYSELTGLYESVMIDNNSEQWDPKRAKYSRTVSWSYAQCCDNTDTGVTYGGEPYVIISGGYYTPLFYQFATITGSDSGDEILLPRAYNNIGKRTDVYNLSDYDLPITLQSPDIFTGSPDETLQTGEALSFIVVAANTWQITTLTI